MARVFSGIQPSGELHLGNYLGAVRNWVADQDEHDAVFCIVDLHAMTAPYDPADLGRRTLDTAALVLAAGLDPDRCTLFVQSHVPEHTELTWILNCLATFGELQRMTQFKEKGHGRESVSAGLFDYPVLMAADILLYDTDRVPVGDDQRQHLELARDIADRFNHRFGPTLVVPEAHIPRVGARIMDLQQPTSKMSKSSQSPQGTLLLTDPPAVVTKKVKSAVTDSGRDVRYDAEGKPGIANLLDIMSAVTGSTVAQLEADYGDAGYGGFKAAVAEAVVEFLRPLQERLPRYTDDPAGLSEVLRQGADKARAVAGPVMERVRSATGLLAP